MNNINLIFKGVRETTKPPKLSKERRMVFCERSGEFSGETIRRIIMFVNGIHKKFQNQKMPIEFDFGEVKLVDKLSYVLFECICFSLIEEYKHRVYLFWRPQNEIVTEGILSSPLLLLNSEKVKHKKKYLERFRFDIYGRHFRRVVDVQYKERKNYLGNLWHELKSFFTPFEMDNDYIKQVNDTVVELVGNACEHCGTDCLLDIDISTDYIKEKNRIKESGDYYGINIAIVNFSETLFGDSLKAKIKAGNSLDIERYQKLKGAFEFHSNHTSESYDEDDFFNIAALQFKISGRMDIGSSGGRGLTKLIKSLQEKSDNDNCYMVSGNRCIFFERDLINKDEKNWIGFNKNNNFFEELPDKAAIDRCPILLSGTAYNLTFVVKRREYE